MLAHISIFVMYFHIFRYLIYAILNTFRYLIRRRYRNPHLIRFLF